MRYMDLFSGIGGFALGLRQAGIEFEEHWFSEIDKNAINIYKKHFPKAKELGDVRTIRDFSGIKADIITFGFPCQDLSVAGKRRGLAGARSGLFFEAMRIIRELKPQYFIFENVKGLLTNNRGADFVRCLREIADIGIYECEWQLVNTRWVLPQNRERVYFVGRLGGQSGAKIFPLSCRNKEAANELSPSVRTFTATQYVKNKAGSYVMPNRMEQKESVNLFVYPRGNNKGGFKNVSNCPTITGSSFEYNTSICPVLTPERENKRQNGRRVKENGEPSFTLTTQDRHGIYDGQAIRRLTPLECERLQGFPDGWTEYGADGRKMSDSARYKALGNAVTVNFPRMIGEKIKPVDKIKKYSNN